MPTNDTPLARSRHVIDVPVTRFVALVSGLLIAVAVIVPRASWLPVVALALLCLAASTDRPSIRDFLRPEPVTISIILLALWAALSTQWSIVHTDGAFKALQLLAMSLIVHVTVRLSERLDEQVSRSLLIGLVTAVVLTAAVIAIEGLTDRAISRAVLNAFPALPKSSKHVGMIAGQVISVDDAELNRRTCVWVLLLWPTVLAVRRALIGRAMQITILIILAEAAVILTTTGHQSSQLAILAGAIIFGLAWLSPWLSRVALAAGWCAAVLLIVPLAIYAYDAGLSRAPWLFFSAKHRVALWSYEARQVVEHPFLGVGADATPRINEAMGPDPNSLSYQEAYRPGHHGHNFYLQVWYELGAVGAFLFLAFGVAVQRVLWRYPAELQGYCLAQFATVASMMATSFGPWMLWTQSAIALSLILTVLAARAIRAL